MAVVVGQKAASSKVPSSGAVAWGFMAVCTDGQHLPRVGQAADAGS
jgi:hypothetical protein